MAERALMVSAGEASGDSLGAAVVRASGRRAWGMGGEALRAAGSRVVVDLEKVAANGLGDALQAVPRAAVAMARLASEAQRQRPESALLIDFTSFNARLGRWLRARGTRVLWCVAPQLWAWRPERGPSLARSMDRLAVLFPFEVAHWENLGVEAHWVGHPALDRLPPDPPARVAERPALVLLPGSRPGEVRRLLPPFLEAAARLRRSDGVAATLLLAPSLQRDLADEATAQAQRQGVAVERVRASEGLGARLPSFDAALCASGTASLECALAGVAPVVAYRVDALTAWAARRWLRIEHIALPNVLLGDRVFPELLQERCDPASLAVEARRLLTAGRARAPAARLRAMLDPGDGRTVGERVAARLP